MRRGGKTMKQLTCIALIFCVAAVLGCAPSPPAPADETETPVAADEPINEEDFESGEVENLVEGGDEDAEEPEETGQPDDDTP
jgi:hypothetical protein